MSRAPLFAMLADLQHAMPQQQAPGSQGFAAPGFAAAEAVPANVFYLPRLKQALPPGSLSRGDEGTIDLLSKVFETVFVDPNIPGEIRELIQFLQIPVLKAALQDKNFFFQEAHPARRMIDLLSRMGWEQHKAPDDPVFQAMQRSVDRVGREFDQGPAVFSAAVAELEASIEAEQAVEETAIAAPIAAALRQEKRVAAARSAKTAVAARIGKGDVIATVETFLENKWTSVLTLAYTVEDDKPGAVKNATRTMDELIWSVKPKITPEQRKGLISKLPGLLAALNRWLDVIKWQDADRLQFFAELAKCHAAIVRAPVELSPERQLELAVEAAQQDALRRIEKENAAAAADEAQAEQEAEPAQLSVETLERGLWLEFDEGQALRKVKLAWISPLRTLFIFSTGGREEAFSLQAEKLVELFRADKVKLVQVDGVVSRVLSQAMQEAAVNDPAPSSHAA